MISAIWSIYRPGYTNVLVYMLQSSEYRIRPYLQWFWRTQDFSKVMYRGKLQRTKAARFLLLALRAGIIIEVLAGLLLIYLCIRHHFSGGWEFGLALILAYPIIWAHLLIVPLYLGRLLIIGPRDTLRVQAAQRIFLNHKGLKIAVAGSYGKTTTKELLLTVLSEGKKVTSTPANKNVAVSHAAFARNLTGDEEILIIEFGEGQPHDVEKFTKVVNPDRAVITGLAPAHLDKYKTLEAAGSDIFSVASGLKGKYVYVNEESPSAADFIKESFSRYSRNGVLGWKVDNVKVSISGLQFDLKKAHKTLNLKSKLLGRHQVGSLSLAAALGMELGIDDRKVIEGVGKTAPFEHRMQPYKLNGAWIIDDTYNGNLEGIRAGTELLAELSAKRKIYVTPGLVDQGAENEAIHLEVGKLIAGANPNKVVLIKNSVCEYIKAGLESAGFRGEISINNHSLTFYTKLDQFVADGDLVMMQNDWPDQYK